MDAPIVIGRWLVVFRVCSIVRHPERCACTAAVGVGNVRIGAVGKRRPGERLAGGPIGKGRLAKGRVPLHEAGNASGDRVGLLEAAVASPHVRRRIEHHLIAIFIGESHADCGRRSHCGGRCAAPGAVVPHIARTHVGIVNVAVIVRMASRKLGIYCLAIVIVDWLRCVVAPTSSKVCIVPQPGDRVLSRVGFARLEVVEQDAGRWV